MVIDEESFTKLVESSLLTIPEEFRAVLQNVVVIVENYPSPDQLKKIGARGRGYLLGLYEGVPKTKRGRYGIGGNLPDKITIFKKPMELLANSEEDIKHMVLDTVEHEIAHHFGMDEEAIKNTKK